MARTTQELVRSIVTDHDPAISMAPFIRAAEVLVDWVVSCDSSLTTATLTEIEGWLAAHFYSVNDQRYESKKTGKSGGKFQGTTGMYLESTTFGQMAIMLDTTGCLAKRNADSKVSRKATIEWLGTDFEDLPLS